MSTLRRSLLKTLCFYSFSLHFIYYIVFPQSGFSQEFPCDLTKLEHLPDLQLSGETHRTPESMADMNIHLYAARNKSVFIGKEGFIHGDSNSLKEAFQPVILRLPSLDDKMGKSILGLEDSKSLLLSKLLTVHMHYSTFQGLGRSSEFLDAMSNLFSHCSHNSDFMKSWSEFTKKIDLKHLNSQEFQDLNQAFLLAFNGKAEESTKLISNSIIMRESSKGGPHNSPTEEIIGLFLLHHLSDGSDSATFQGLGETLENLNKFLNTRAHPAACDSSKSIGLDRMQQKFNLFKGLNDKFALDYRNEHMAKNIANGYCQAALDKKPFIAILGSRHLEGIKSMLEQMSNGKVKPKVRNATDSGLALLKWDKLKKRFLSEGLSIPFKEVESSYNELKSEKLKIHREHFSYLPYSEEFINIDLKSEHDLKEELNFIETIFATRKSMEESRKRIEEINLKTESQKKLKDKKCAPGDSGVGCSIM